MFFRRSALLFLLALCACGNDQERGAEPLTAEELSAHNAPGPDGECSDLVFDEGAPGGLFWQTEIEPDSAELGRISFVDGSIDPCGNYFVGFAGSDSRVVKLFPDGTEDWRLRVEDWGKDTYLLSLVATPEGRLLFSASDGLHVHRADGSPDPSVYPWNLQGLTVGGMLYDHGRYLGFCDGGVTEFSPDGWYWTPMYGSRAWISSQPYRGFDVRYADENSSDFLISNVQYSPIDSSEYTRIDGQPPPEPKPRTATVVVNLFHGQDGTHVWSQEFELAIQRQSFVQGKTLAIGYTPYSYACPVTHLTNLEGTWDWEAPGCTLFDGAVALTTGDILVLLTDLGEGGYSAVGRPTLTRLSAEGEVIGTLNMTEEWGAPLFEADPYYGPVFRLSPDERRLLVVAPIEEGEKAWIGALDAEILK